MGELSKNLKFNNGSLISFENIKENREQAVLELAENNDGLFHLLNTCIDNDIKTIASCGDKSLHITFEINDKTRSSLITLVTILDVFYNNNNKIFDIKLGNSKKMCDLYLDVHILTSFEESFKYFKAMSIILNSSIKIDYYEKYNLMEKLVLGLSLFIDNVSIELFNESFNNKNCNYDYILHIGKDNKIKEKNIVEEFKKLDRYHKWENFDSYGIVDSDMLQLLIDNFKLSSNKVKNIDSIKRKLLLKK